MKNRQLVPLIVLLLISASSAFPGIIHSDLKMRLSELNENEKIEVVIGVAGGLSVDELKKEMASVKSNSLRHAYAINRLKKVASAKQEDLRKELNELSRQKKAQGIKCYWIVNAIKATLDKAQIENISKRDDVTEIRLVPTALPIDPVDNSQYKSGYVESNIVYVGADSAWRMGYTGEGRIVANYEISGVDGHHPALYDNWKGHDGDTAAAYLDRRDTVMFPIAYDGHGTHTTGTMIGHDDITGDTVGIAPDAKWIASSHSSILDTYQWLADPDGNPNTTADVPDVINNSWGWTYDCLDWIWEAIDHTEALGIVNIFSAGNEGSDPMTIRSPASRAEDSLNSFAVGAIHHLTGLITHFSSRGPSNCDSLSIKPNIVAPGGDIRSCAPDNDYIFKGGTSMSAPHVSGAVAILRQYAPDATVDQVKEALLVGATPIGSPSPNNTYGWGLLNIPGALEYLEESLAPDIRVVRFDYDTLDAGNEVTVGISLTNHSHDIDSIRADFEDSYPGMTILTDSLYFGRIDYYDTIPAHQMLRIVTDDTLFPGTVLNGSFTLRGTRNFVKEIPFSIQAGFEPQKTFYTHQSDVMQFSISNFGQYGFGATSIRNLGYNGFRYNDTTRNVLYEAALVIGDSPERVSDGLVDEERKYEDDFRVAVGGEIELFTPGQIADQETYSFYDDFNAAQPIGLRIDQRTFSWNESPDDNYVIIEYSIENMTDEILSDLYVGLYFDWMYYVWHDDFVHGHYSPAENLGYMFYSHETYHDSVQFLGLSVINLEGVESYRLLQTEVWDKHGYTNEEKYEFLSGGFVDTSCIGNYITDMAHIITTGPFTLLPNTSDTAVFAVIGADYLNQLRSSAIRARNKYFLETSIDDDNSGILPGDFALYQNYPNPFNSRTIIEFALPTKSDVEISVYNILGRKIANVLSKELPVGYHTVSWDGKDYSGRDVASGIYFYQLKAGNSIKSEKMLLLK